MHTSNRIITAEDAAYLAYLLQPATDNGRQYFKRKGGSSTENNE